MTGGLTDIWPICKGSVPYSLPMSAITTRLRIWGSGVRISSGAPTNPINSRVLRSHVSQPSSGNSERKGHKIPKSARRVPKNSEVVHLSFALRLRLGRGGRRFKSCHSDQHLAKLPVPSGPTSGTDTPIATWCFANTSANSSRERMRTCASSFFNPSSSIAPRSQQ